MRYMCLTYVAPTALTEQYVSPQWRTDRKREQQLQRRAKYRRIDYYPDELVAGAIDALTGRGVGGAYSSVLNRVVSDWCHRNKVGPRTKAPD